MTLTSALDDGRNYLVVPGPDELARRVHGHGRLLATQLDNDGTIVKTHGNALLALLIRDTPRALQAVVERLFEAVCVGVPDTDGSVFRTGDDDWQFGVVAGEGNIVGVAFEGRNQGLGGVIPDLDGAVVGRCEDVRLVRVWVVVDVVHALGLVRLEGEVGRWGAQAPNLDGSVQTCRCEGVCVFGVDRQSHNVVAVALEHLDALPALLPIPELNCHVIRCGEDEGLRGVNGDGSDVVGMRLEGGDLLGGVVVVDTHLEVIGATDNPVLPRDEATGADGNVGKLECLDDLLCFVRPDIDMTCPVSTALPDPSLHVHTAVQSRENPWLVRMEVDALDSLRASIELALRWVSLVQEVQACCGVHGGARQ